MRNIIITGGELINKGAQAMTFVAVHEIKKRFPDHEVYLLSEMDLARPPEERARYAFGFTGWYPIKFARCQHNPFLRLACRVRNGRELAAAESLYTRCDAMIDISGYALGSNWSVQNNDRYLNHLEFAKAFDIPVYLMPQSFGPFDFDDTKKNLQDRCRTLLPTVKRIFAREQEGYDALVQTFGLTNVQLAKDLVLCNRGIDLANIFKEQPVFDLPEIAPHSVAVIPNSRNSEVGSHDALLALYDRIMKQLSKQNRRVYLLHHSSVDAKLCAAIKARFADDANVILLEQDFSCLEFNALVKHFDFLIASRFHSIVHAFKNGVPCIALGWAAKYHDLLSLFGQEIYMFDVRGRLDPEAICAAIEQMNGSCADESVRILERLTDVQRDNVFDILCELQKETQ